MKFLLIFVFVVIGCNSNSQEMVDKNNEKIQLIINSPSERCNYDMLFTLSNVKVVHTQKPLTDTTDIKTNSSIILSDKNIKKVEDLIKSLSNNKPFSGKLWKDGWHYVVLYNEVKKVDVYEIEESEIVKALLDIVESQSDIKVDYTCF